jgi:hypothetical protein
MVAACQTNTLRSRADGYLRLQASGLLAVELVSDSHKGWSRDRFGSNSSCTEIKGLPLTRSGFWNPDLKVSKLGVLNPSAGL